MKHTVSDILMRNFCRGVLRGVPGVSGNPTEVVQASVFLLPKLFCKIEIL